MTTTAETHTCCDEDEQYQAFLQGIERRFTDVTRGHKALFRTDASMLFPNYFLRLLPEDRRQHYNCHACQRFMERYGGLVVIGSTGETYAAMWDETTAPPFFAEPVRRLQNVVEGRPITDVFRTKETVLGEPVTGPWHHMSVHVPAALATHLAPKTLLNAQQCEAAVREEYTMLSRGLTDFKVDVLLKARALLQSEALYRSEKCLGVAEWLLDLHRTLDMTKNHTHKRNLVWRAAATAPPGWCHVRSTMIGTLLEDLAAGMPYEQVARRFADKMHPLQYQRPTAKPTDNQINEAEKVIRKLKAANALARRFAKLEDLELLWKPPVPEPKKTTDEAGGVFDHLRSKKHEVIDIDGPARSMTWAKFKRDVLPSAQKIEYYVPHGHSNFLAFVTAVDPKAPVLLQWDHHVSHYVYNDGSLPSKWGLFPDTFVEVTGVALTEHQWPSVKQPITNRKEFVTFLLKGAWDHEHQRSGGMFPEAMKAEYHGIRKVIEAHFMQAPIEGREEATACGVCFVAGPTTKSFRLRVTADGVRQLYTLDRWD